MEVSPSELLARRFAAAAFAELADPLLHEMRRLLLDYCGVGIAGAQSETGRIARRFATRNGGAPQSSVFHEDVRLPAVHAAFANAISEHSIEMDDVDDLALFHYGPPIVSAALAVAERCGSSVRELLVAMAAGCEMMNRLSLALNPRLRDRGFHTTPVCGAIGAAVAAGRLLGLSSAQMVSAIGLAGAQSSGLMEMYGPSMQKRINPGPAARNGVTAAELAQDGFSGAATILEGERGLGRAFAGSLDVARLLASIDGPPEFEVEYKPYAAARPIHAAVDCALAIRSEEAVEVGSIREIVVHRHPDWIAYHSNTSPRNFHEAQVSLPFAVAIALADGRAFFTDFSDENTRRSDLAALMAVMTFRSDATLPRGVSVRLEIALEDGSRIARQVDDPKGSRANPMTDRELEAKFRALAAPVITESGASHIVDAIWNAGSADGLDELTSLVRGAGGHVD